MRITFVLPAYIRRPNGGFKVVYEYASRLQARGHDVAVVHPYFWTFANLPFAGLRAARWRLTRGLTDRPLAAWFPHHPGVRLVLAKDLSAASVPDGDVVFATGWQTAAHVTALPAAKGAKYYLIQHHETWAGPKDEVDATWTMPLHKVVIARWLRDLAIAFGEGERTAYIPNGIDLDRFPLIEPIESRNPKRIGMLYHGAEWKGTNDGITALEHVRAVHPNLETVVFGTRPRAAGVPDWIEYVEHPSPAELTALYNSCAIFLHPSWAEGWPLPPAEAMASGCALVAAANQGVQDYATDGDTALMAPVKDAPALADRLLRLLADDPLRQRLAHAGHDHIQTFTWPRAVDRLETLLTATHVQAEPRSNDGAAGQRSGGTRALPSPGGR